LLPTQKVTGDVVLSTNTPANVGFLDVQIDRKAKTRRQLSLYYFGYQVLHAPAIVC
jgi:hypothetical protein